jgi:hypothetical protein
MSSPTVLYPLTLPGLLHYILTTQSSACPTLLVICSSRVDFIQHLADSIQKHHEVHETNHLEQLVTPTLHTLLTTRHVQLAFCASVQALLAYMTAYGRPGTKHVGSAHERGRLVLVDPLALHAPTSSFSAQGLSRTFAAAAETALRTGVNLHVVECEGRRVHVNEHDEEDADMENALEENHTQVQTQDPWEQDVSILNVSAKRFGSGTNERAWAGRTVKVKRIAARWFRFHSVEDRQNHEDLGTKPLQKEVQSLDYRNAIESPIGSDLCILSTVSRRFVTSWQPGLPGYPQLQIKGKCQMQSYRQLRPRPPIPSASFISSPS